MTIRRARILTLWLGGLALLYVLTVTVASLVVRDQGVRIRVVPAVETTTTTWGNGSMTFEEFQDRAPP